MEVPPVASGAAAHLCPKFPATHPLAIRSQAVTPSPRKPPVAPPPKDAACHLSSADERPFWNPRLGLRKLSLETNRPCLGTHIPRHGLKNLSAQSAFPDGGSLTFRQPPYK